MLSSVKADIAKAFVGRLSKDNDLKTTVVGCALCALVAANELDWPKLFAGDSAQLGKAAAVLLGAVISFYINKPNKEK